jgi:uroporphyrinogen decarboxylase
LTHSEKEKPVNSRERMLAVIEHQTPDRIPTDIWAVPEVWTKLQEHFGKGADVCEALHVDGIAGVGAKYVGPALPKVAQDESVDFWGIRSRRVEFGAGVYYEQFHHPLAAAETIDDLRQYRWPSPEWFDYSQMRPAAQANREKQVLACGYMAPFTYHQYLRGLEASLADLLLKPEFTEYLLGRLCDFVYEHHRRMFAACEGLIDLTQVTDDYGTQTGPIMSLATFRRFYRPHLQRFIDLAHEFGIRAFHHDDGAIREFLPDLAEMGIDVLNPIQWRCPGMEREALKRDFGRAFCFHGGVDNQQTLPFGSAEDVRAEVRHNIDVLAADRTGYVVAPCHNLQSITPLENIIAMYDEAHHYGRF